MAKTSRVDSHKLLRLDGGVTELFLRKCDYAGIVPHSVMDLGAWRENPINRILSDDYRYEQATRVGLEMPEIRSKDGQLPAVFWARAQILCQQLLWHHGHYGREPGPEGDSLPKTLRKLWYAGHKAAFQQISNRCGVWRLSDSVINDKAANQALSQVYGDFIDTKEVTYLDAFIEDGSRMFYHNPYPLPAPYSNLLICVEKDAAYADMVSIGKALGARCVVSGGGKMGKAGTEKMLRECFSHWYEGDVGNMIDWQNKLRVVVISDWDYDGEVVIAPTFVEQIYRYVNRSNVESVRIGIKPEHLQEFGRDVINDPEVSYRAKNSTNAGYSEWCAEKAVYIYEDELFNGLYEVMDYDEWQFKQALTEAGISAETLTSMFPEYGSQEDRRLNEWVKDWKWDGRAGLHPKMRFLTHKELVKLYQRFTPLGFELDAIKRVEYAEVVAGAMGDILDWDDLLEALSDKVLPDVWEVAHELARNVLSQNEQYRELGEKINKIRAEAERKVAHMESERRRMANRIHEAIEKRVEAHKDDEEVFEDDPAPTTDDLGISLKDHYDEDDYAEHWQPYDKRERESALADLVRENSRASLDRLAKATMKLAEEPEQES